MNPKLKPLNEQVIVITGASSGIGLATARRAAKAGARLVLASRSDEALEQLVREIELQGGRAVHVGVDVGVEEDVRLIAETASREFDGFDTWVNNAGVSVYGHALEVPTRDMRRVFDTNFWGVVHGTRVACETLRTRGGAIINVGSEVSDRAVPLQAIYSASKHAVKGWTDAVRTELQQMQAPISLTLIKPGPIDTPYTQHARNYLADRPTHVPPVYAPQSVADAILYAACTPVRDLFVGGAAKMVATMNTISPRLADAVVGPAIGLGTHSGRPRSARRDALFDAGGRLEERGDYEGLVRQSLYTKAAIHPMLTTALALGTGLLIASAWQVSTARSTRARVAEAGATRTGRGWLARGVRR